MADDGSVDRAKTYFSSPDEGDDKQMRARRLVVEYYNEHVFGSTPELSVLKLGLQGTYVVLFSYVLGSWKANVSTVLPDGRYYEVTFNKEKNETYVDEYKKVNNVVYKEETDD